MLTFTLGLPASDPGQLAPNTVPTPPPPPPVPDGAPPIIDPRILRSKPMVSTQPPTNEPGAAPGTTVGPTTPPQPPNVPAPWTSPPVAAPLPPPVNTTPPPGPLLPGVQPVQTFPRWTIWAGLGIILATGVGIAISR